MMCDLETARRVVLRSSCLVTGGLAIAVAVLGFYPGYKLSGRELEVVPVASSPLGLVAVMAILLGVVAYVWRRPTIANALLGSVVSVGVSVFMLVLTAPPFDDRTVHALEASAVATRVVLALVTVQIALVPIACGLLARAAYLRRPDRIARARVHRVGHG